MIKNIPMIVFGMMICRHVVFAMRRQKKLGTVGPRKQDGDPERRAICDYCGSC